MTKTCIQRRVPGKKVFRKKPKTTEELDRWMDERRQKRAARCIQNKKDKEKLQRLKKLKSQYYTEIIIPIQAITEGWRKVSEGYDKMIEQLNFDGPDVIDLTNI